MFPITTYAVEDIKAEKKKGQRRWNVSFSPLEVGKNKFYRFLKRWGTVILKSGWETKLIRDELGLKKTKSKMSEKFEAHCVDSWVLANSEVSGFGKLDNKQLLRVVPFRFYRRQLHVMNYIKGSFRKTFGGTRSLGFKRGSLVKHPKYGVCYVGGAVQHEGLKLHSCADGKRLSHRIKPKDCTFLTYCSWRAQLLPIS